MLNHATCGLLFLSTPMKSFNTNTTKTETKTDMGTNYYLRLDVCPHCNRAERELHIGKSSAGWVFALRVHPFDDINTLDDWKPLFTNERNRIFNEYGDIVSVDDLIKNITNRSWTHKREHYGYKSMEDMLERNYAIEGPNGLMRRKISHGCIGHGGGTWDYMDCDFS